MDTIIKQLNRYLSFLHDTTGTVHYGDDGIYFGNLLMVEWWQVKTLTDEEIKGYALALANVYITLKWKKLIP